MAETTGSRKAQSGMVTGLFRDRESAERAYGSLLERGYQVRAMSEETKPQRVVKQIKEREDG